MVGPVEFAWLSSHDIIDASGGAKIGQSSLQTLGHAYPQIALRSGLVLTDLSERHFVECDFQGRYRIGLSLEGQPTY